MSPFAKEVGFISTTLFLRRVAAFAGLLTFVPFVVFSHGERVVDGRLEFHLSGATIYDSNVFSNSQEEGDVSATLMPEVSWLRAKGLIVLDVRGGVEIIRFLDLTALNAENYFGNLYLSYPNRSDATTIGAFHLGWRQRSSTRELLGIRTDSETLNVGLAAQMQVSEKLAYRWAADYQHEFVRTAGLSDRQVWTLEGETIFISSENLSLTGGYRFRTTETAGNQRTPIDAQDHLFRLGAKGQLMPKLAGSTSVGAQYRRIRGSDQSDRVNPYADVSLSWTPKVRTAVNLTVGKDFEATADDRSVDHTSLRLSVRQGLYGKWSLEPFLSYSYYRIASNDQAIKRADDVYGGGLGLHYSLDSASVALRYAYFHRDSTGELFNYHRHLIELRGTISF